MELLILLLLVFFIIIFLNFQSRWRDTIKIFTRITTDLINELDALKEQLKRQAGSESKVSTTTVIPKESPITPSTPKHIFKPLETQNNVNQQKKPEQVYSLFNREEQLVTNNLNKELKEHWYIKWKRNHPDWEKFIGENLTNKIGIAILVLGVAFFVKYAIDKDWINETGRVSIGLLFGAVLTILAHRLRKEYRSFSSVLAGGGIAVFYSTIAFAFQGYSLISQTVAFILMVVITIFAVVLSLLYNRLELAIIAAIGGFTTPFLVSNGEGNYIVLFTYLIILNTGLLILAYYKRWIALNILSIMSTVILTGGWLTYEAYSHTKNVSYTTVMLFITVLYCIFFTMNLVYQVKNKTVFKSLDFSILLFLSACYYAAGMIVLNWINNGAYQGLFTLGCGLVDLVLAWYFFKRKQTDRNLLFLLIGLTMTFISLAVPIQLNGHAITLFWSAEFVLMYWLFQQSGIKLFKLSSIIVMVLSLISLGMDWVQASEKSAAILLIYNNLQGFVTNLVSATAFITYSILLNKNKEIKFGEDFSNLQLKRSAWTIAILLLYATSIFGINLIYHTYPNYIVPNVFHRLTTEIFAFILIAWLIKKTTTKHTTAILILTILSFLHYFFSQPLIEGLRNAIISGIYPGIYIIIHFIADGILLLLTFISIKSVIKNNKEYKYYYTGLSWIVSIVLITFFSFELVQPFVLIGAHRLSINNLLDQYNKAILTIIWSLCSFALMWLGMRYKNKLLRIISLTVFSIALLKLFALDIQNISEGGKIIAFILLGILLLTISFMYQKLKKILIVNDPH